MVFGFADKNLAILFDCRISFLPNEFCNSKILKSLLMPICFSIKLGVMFFSSSIHSNNLSISFVILVKSVPRC